MENATRALTMAGGILLALMILGALMLMFSNLSSYQNQNDASTKDSQIAEFNNQYMPYEKDDLTLMELKSLYNKIESNNAKNEEKIYNNIEDIYADIDKNFAELPEEHKQNAVFKCTEIKYENPGGKISYMGFAIVKLDV